MSAIELRPWMTKQQAAEYAGVSVKTIERWIREGRLQVARPSATLVRIRPEWVDEAINAA